MNLGSGNQASNNNQNSGSQQNSNSDSEELPDVKKIREQFKEIANVSDPLTREYKFSLLENEARKLGISSENYRRLFETYLQNQLHIPQYPQKRWLLAEWISWLIKFPNKRKVGTTILLRLLEKGVLVSLLVSLVSYYREAPKRKQQAHYQAWEIINGANNQTVSGGRIEALQLLNQDGVSLRNINLDKADLSGINLNNAFLIGVSFKDSKLTCVTIKTSKSSSFPPQCTKIRNSELSWGKFQEANLFDADFQKSIFWNAEMQEARLIKAKLQGANFENTQLQNAYLNYANLEKAELMGANFQDADLENANLKDAIICDQIDESTEPEKIICANFIGAKNLTATQIKSAKNWQNGCYDFSLRKELNLPGDNPAHCNEK